MQAYETVESPITLVSETSENECHPWPESDIILSKFWHSVTIFVGNQSEAGQKGHSTNQVCLVTPCYHQHSTSLIVTQWGNASVARRTPIQAKMRRRRKILQRRPRRTTKQIGSKIVMILDARRRMLKRWLMTKRQWINEAPPLSELWCAVRLWNGHYILIARRVGIACMTNGRMLTSANGGSMCRETWRAGELDMIAMRGLSSRLSWLLACFAVRGIQYALIGSSLLFSASVYIALGSPIFRWRLA